MIKKILLLLLFTSSLAFAQKQDATRQIINLPQAFATQSAANPQPGTFSTVVAGATNPTTIGSSGVTFPDGTVKATAAKPWNWQIPAASSSAITMTLPVTAGIAFQSCAGTNACVGTSVVAASASTTLILKRNGTPFCTATFASGATTATFSCSTTALANTLPDVLTISYSGNSTLIPSVSLTVVN